jgi:hypothetical protein
MAISSLAGLFGSGAMPSTNPYDLITGKVPGVADSLMPPSFYETKLTSYQNSGLQKLKDYIDLGVKDKNITSEIGLELIGKLGAIESLFKLGNKEAIGPDPVFALVGGNSESFRYLPQGSLLNGLF